MAATTQRTWIGGGNNKATNPNDWSPTGDPQVGDSLMMTRGTMNVSRNDLAGDSLTVSGGDINTHGRTLLDLNLRGGVNVHVDDTLLLTVNQFAAHVNFSGGTIHFIGSNGFLAFSTEFDSKLVGHATIKLGGENFLAQL
jgi:hypothetical protein